MKKSLWVAAAAFVAWVAPSAARSDVFDDDGAFDGGYVGAELSRHNVIGGALLGGIDVLAQEQRFAAGVFAGVRRQFNGGLVLGLEAGFGLEDGDLSFQSTVPPVTLSYESDVFLRYGGIAGWAFGANRETLVYAYIHETQREFEVTGSAAGAPLRQGDQQGLLGYGLGVERVWGLHTRWRARIGSSRADFSLPTNIDPDEPIDLSIGIVYQH